MASQTNTAGRGQQTSHMLKTSKRGNPFCKVCLCLLPFPLSVPAREAPSTRFSGFEEPHCLLSKDVLPFVF
jgi:hypothetical protein